VDVPSRRVPTRHQPRVQEQSARLFAVRDDDTNFFTRCDQLEAAYADIWDHVPVTLSVVPFHASTRSKAIPQEYWSGDREFPLHENADLVTYLRTLLAQGRISVALHGYSHRNYPAGFEFEVATDLEHKIRRGRAYLEDLLGVPVSVFVPPHNALSRRGLEALERTRMNVLGSFLSFHPSRKPWDFTTPGNYLRLTLYRLRLRRGRSQKVVYPFPLRYRRHAEFACHNLVPGTSAAQLLDGLRESERAGGHFCLATHYWELDQELSSILREVISSASSDPRVRFVPASALFDVRLAA
jgi:hypothetical protein